MLSKDCKYEIWVPESPEYDVETITNYLGAVWDKNEISAIHIQIPRIIEKKPARTEWIFIPAEYETIEKYMLRKRAKMVTRDRK